VIAAGETLTFMGALRFESGAKNYIL